MNEAYIIDVSTSAYIFSLTLGKLWFDCGPHGCPCGYYGDPLKECTCSPILIQKYRARVSGPLLDRIDIHIEVPPVRYKELSGEDKGESSSEIRKRVNAARDIQKDRFGRMKIHSNSQGSAA